MDGKKGRKVRMKEFLYFFRFSNALSLSRSLALSQQKRYMLNMVFYFCDFSWTNGILFRCPTPPFAVCGWVSISTRKIRFISHIHSILTLPHIASATNIYYLFPSVNLFTMLAYNPKSFLSNVFIHFYCFIFHVRVYRCPFVRACASACACVKIMDNKKKKNDEEAPTK